MSNTYDCTLVRVTEHEGTTTESVLKSFQVTAWSYFEATQLARAEARPGASFEYLKILQVKPVTS